MTTRRDDLSSLRKWRNRAAPDLSIKAEVDSLRKKVVRSAKALGGLDDAWEEIVPREWGVVVKLSKLTAGGVLVVECPDASAAYALDQWKRAGGLEALRGRCSATLRDVRVVVKPNAERGTRSAERSNSAETPRRGRRTP